MSADDLAAALDELELAVGGDRDTPEHCETCRALATLARLAERERDEARGWAHDQQPDLVQLLRVRARAAEAREAALREALVEMQSIAEDKQASPQGRLAAVHMKIRAALAEKS